MRYLLIQRTSNSPHNVRWPPLVRLPSSSFYWTLCILLTLYHTRSLPRCARRTWKMASSFHALRDAVAFDVTFQAFRVSRHRRVAKIDKIPSLDFYSRRYCRVGVCNARRISRRRRNCVSLWCGRAFILFAAYDLS